MKTLIVYITRHGCAQKVAFSLKDKINGEVDMLNLREKQKTDLNFYDTIVLGGSIHMGKIHKRLKTFCEHYDNDLLNKKLGIFLCHMYQGDVAVRQYEEAFSEKLRNHAIAKGLLGGEFEFEKMNLIEKMMVRKIANTKKSISQIDEQAIVDFVDKMNEK